MNFFRSFLLLLVLSTAVQAAVQASQYFYVDWTSADVANGTASGVITLPDSSTVTVEFNATNPDGSHGSLYFAQTDGGTNYWIPPDPYISNEVENVPPDSDIISLSGETTSSQIYTVTLSEPIKDPIMAIVSLGSSTDPATYEFDSPFEIVSQGTGWWGGTDTSLVQSGNDLTGREGHGTIQFLGTFQTFSWVITDPETWHGFTFGIRTTEALEPPAEEASPVSVPTLTNKGLAFLFFALIILVGIKRRKLQ